MDRAPVDAAAVRDAAHQWARITVVDATESTNSDLLADVDAPDRSVLVAEHQTAGRGRLDRTWTSPPMAGLTFSILLRPTAPIGTWGWLSLLTGVCLHDAVRDDAGADVALKWPNDLLHRPSGLKLAGILAQTSGAAVVIGIGLNVSTTAPELPVETATSLALCGASTLDRTQLLAAVLGQLGRRVSEWEAVAGDAEASGLADAYRSACATLGRNVAVTTTGGQRLVGNALAVDSSGRLQLAVHGGVQAIGAGDVEHLRSTT
jgi:BirA family biotin operon repressor/biotin-[acetyl-CoA-carboxylase] ligase